ncbi:MAG: hypothetical protein JW783_03120 [Bacteroidales bacterium]|nr:hypothetical protein [Bacteroidales bacterium]MBN2749025.1 hypothetical protein [Bacteroidales bacterium]
MMSKKPNTKHLSIVLIIMLFGASLLVSCEEHQYEPLTFDADVEISFKDNIQPIFDGNCIGCHNGGISPDFRADKSYTSLIDGSYVNLEAPASSRLYVKLTGSGSHQDFLRGKIIAVNDTIDALATDVILKWIEQGAKDN